jgi:hypothetical protein
MGYMPSGSTLGQVVGDLTLIAFYYLLYIEEYTVKGNRNESKQTAQFKLEDITFFQRNEQANSDFCCTTPHLSISLWLSAQPSN